MGIISRNSNSTVELFPAAIVSQIVRWLDVIEIKDVLLAIPSWQRFAIIIKDVYQKDGCHVPRYPLWFELPGVQVMELDDVSDYGRLSPLPVIRLLEVYWYSKKNYLNDTLERFLTTDRELFNNCTFMFFYGRNVTSAQQTIEYVMNSVDATLFERNKALVGTTWDFHNVNQHRQSVVKSVYEMEQLPECHHLVSPLYHLYSKYAWLHHISCPNTATGLASLFIEGVDVVQNLRLPMLTHLRVSFTAKAVGPPIIRRLRLPRLEYMRIHFRDVALPLLYDVDVASLSAAEPVFDLTDPTAVLATKPPVQDRHTRIQDYEEHQDLRFLSVFHTVVVIGVPDFFVRGIPTLDVVNFVWYKTRQYDEDVPIVKEDNFQVSRLAWFTFYTNIPYATLPSFAKVLRLPDSNISSWTVFTAAPYTNINGLLGRWYSMPAGSPPSHRWEVSLVCRLKPDDLGGDGHITLSKSDLQYPLLAPIVYFSFHIEGCLFGPYNLDVWCHPPGNFESSRITRLESKTVSARERLMASNIVNIIMVRQKEHLLDPHDALCPSIPVDLMRRVRYGATTGGIFAIDQVRGPPTYQGWSQLVLYNPTGHRHQPAYFDPSVGPSFREILWWY